jgi:hypothetical protein
MHGGMLPPPPPGAIHGPGPGPGPTVIPDPGPGPTVIPEPEPGPGPMTGPGAGPCVGPTIICATAAVTGPISSAAANSATRECVIGVVLPEGSLLAASFRRRPLYQPHDSGSKAAERPKVARSPFAGRLTPVRA